MKSLWWRLRWAVWDLRNRLFVRYALKLLKREHVVYIHEYGAKEADAVLVEIDVWYEAAQHLDLDNLSHTHVEARDE